MSLLFPMEMLLVNLEEDVDPGYVFIHFPKEAALRELREATGQDFGYDAVRWRLWLEEHDLVRKANIPEEMLKILEDDFPAGYLRREGCFENARRRLIAWTGQDFGTDPKKWRRWLVQHKIIPWPRLELALVDV